MKMQKNWWLGFLGFVGVYKFPNVIDAFQGEKSWLTLISLIWLLWFGYFIPEKKEEEEGK
ncbi:hypothetical protein D0U04_14720 [Bacillus clarus]|uniref:Putative membrane protein n=1 Tax=Bacillus clarus TaxID=2338372 RepID=A0A090YJZ3_9BACI|nr:hypothetical protein [Bacillus clarus]KFM98799.1 putative membrane protein [Bacillus clarus]RFT66237.1 hypothetical protein D0U04_14720 [Bacillus clarus]